MKKILVIALIPLFLASCGSSSDTSTSDSSLKKFEGNGYSIQIPSGWIKVDEKSAPTPGNGKLEAAWSSTEIASGFANNMVILSETLSKPMTSAKYSSINYALSTGNYVEFTKLDEKTISFPVSENMPADEANIYTFEAKYNPQTPKRKFIQTARVCGDTVYLMTIGINLEIKDTAKYENLFKSFTCGEKK